MNKPIDGGEMQHHAISDALALVTALLADDDGTLARQTTSAIAKELLENDAHGHARLHVYLYQSANLTELALGLAAMATGKPISEIHQALAAAVANGDWST